MITAYVHANGALQPIALSNAGPLPPNAIWVDLAHPKPEEEALLEQALHLELPTREEMREIEVSSRLYQENGALFLTAAVVHKSDTDSPQSDPITFIIAGHRLVTIRYSDPLPFHLFANQARRQAPNCVSGEAVLAELLEAIVDRTADLLERVQHDVNEASNLVFSRVEKVDYQEVLRRVGRSQGLISRTRESLVSINRLLLFLTRVGESKPNKVLGRSFKTLARDVLSLSDHASFLSNNINFLLDGTLGMINIEQTGIIKIFSVAAVAFLPPTLIASIYGMNFEFMPELKSSFGYPVSLGLMLFSALIPLYFFKRRGWL